MKKTQVEQMAVDELQGIKLTNPELGQKVEAWLQGAVNEVMSRAAEAFDEEEQFQASTFTEKLECTDDEAENVQQVLRTTAFAPGVYGDY